MPEPYSDREPRPVPGGRPPLFDRLTDLDPDSHQEVVPFRILSRDELRESVRREVARLLNTRSSRPLDFQGDEELTVLDYGIPDFTSLSASSDTDRRRLGAMLVRAISTFEPRLGGVEVILEKSTENEASLLGRINAWLEIESVREPVSFPVVIEAKTGKTNVLEQ